ncbi:MAG: EscU/YscU/HrcU family type III secretion system export apparatus switch protein [Proteobacteria bacterium]|nr:EscU/YscU/HrcU family type III secretion system export apparatus switch protein [Pseudomonadota bacterium]MBU1717109.1 EscU/YscU/HrcU family type III secretion system export apparatus switch protein [Pseudomonadota bacterium]
MDKPEKNRQRVKKAVALRYDKARDQAPKVIGKGSGHIAEKILELAREHGIPVQEDSDLVEVLSSLDLNEQIPPSAYLVVAEILAFIYRTNASFKP